MESARLTHHSRQVINKYTIMRDLTSGTNILKDPQTPRDPGNSKRQREERKKKNGSGQNQRKHLSLTFREMH